MERVNKAPNGFRLQRMLGIKITNYFSMTEDWFSLFNVVTTDCAEVLTLLVQPQ